MDFIDGLLGDTDILDVVATGATIYSAVNQVKQAKKANSIRQQELNVMKQKEAAAAEMAETERRKLQYSKGIARHFANADTHGGYAVPTTRIQF